MTSKTIAILERAAPESAEREGELLELSEREMVTVAGGEGGCAGCGCAGCGCAGCASACGSGSCSTSDVGPVAAMCNNGSCSNGPAPGQCGGNMGNVA